MASKVRLLFPLCLAVIPAFGAPAAGAADPPAVPAPASTQAPAPASSVPPASGADPADAEKLKGVTVKGKRDLLDESDARMKKLKESLPDINSDAGHKETFAQRVVDKTKAYLANHTDPNKINDDGKALIERAQNGVDNTQNAGKPTIDQPDAKDYSDPLCQAGSCPP
jgi:hypothetical protein